MGVLTLILLSLGAGLYFAIRRQLSHQLDASLRTATTALRGAARTREIERARATGPVADAVRELRIPDRTLYLLDTAGRGIVPEQVPDWVAMAARRAAQRGSAEVDIDTPDDHEIRLHAERFSGVSGTPYVAAAEADRLELEDRYASLIGVFAVATIAALILVAVGGSLLVHQSTAPIERSMEQMRRFMADAAHELRTPITILRTRADVTLREDRDAARDAAALAAIGLEAERLGVVVGDLLTLARADAGEWPMTRGALYLDDVSIEAVEAIRALADQRGVTVEVGAFEETGLRGDPVLLRRLVLILLDNAIKFTPARGRVTVDVRSTGGRAVVVIADTGRGIPPEVLPHVFDRFYRGERQSTEGAGLGLSIARWIVELHGGTIEIQSTVGEGTKVTVSLPQTV